MLDAWARLDVEGIVGHFTADAVWDDPSHGPLVGSEAIRSAVQGYVGRMSSADMEILHLLAVPGMVMTERVDRFVFDGRDVAAPIMGIFELDGEKIAAWRDYFDTKPTPT